MQKRRLIALTPLALVALAACGESNSDEVLEPNPTVAVAHVVNADDTRNQIFAMDTAWEPEKICPYYRSVVPAGTAPAPAMEEFIVSNYEDGFGQTLTPAAREHLLDKLETC